jgi:hypothetical protein
MPPPRSPWIEGKATLTTTASRVMTKKPRTAAASVNPERERPRPPGLNGWGLASSSVDTDSALLDEGVIRVIAATRSMEPSITGARESLLIGVLAGTPSHSQPP